MAEFKTHLKLKYGTFGWSIGLKWLPQKRIWGLLTSHKCHCSHPVHIHGSNHTHCLTSLQ